jgi:pyrroloquinoline quinone (PQQ) biosynthesis protein C
MSTTMPLIRRTATFRQDGDSIVLSHLSSEVTLEGRAAALLAKMLPHLDGTNGIETIAARIGEPSELLGALTERLASEGVVAFTAPGAEAETISGERFYELHRRYGTHWLTTVYEHPLWEKITSGRATRAQVLGFAFEKYHYIEGAYEHMAIAASHATPEMMPHLARHFIEEYTHGDIYRKGLRSLFRDDVILAAQPLPTTRALVNFLSEAAAKSSFAYYAGNEVLQMTENTSDPDAGSSVDSFYGAMRAHYPYTEKIIASFIAHTQADQKLGHDDVFLQMCRSVPALTRKEVREALNVARGTVEHLVCFLDGIDRFYERFPTIPRTAGDPSAR